MRLVVIFITHSFRMPNTPRGENDFGKNTIEFLRIARRANGYDSEQIGANVRSVGFPFTKPPSRYIMLFEAQLPNGITLAYALDIVSKRRSFNQNRFGVWRHIGENLMNKEKVVIYIHGKGGNAQEAEHFRGVFDCDVVGLDYVSTTPWQAKEEFPKLWDNATFGYKTVEVVANSIGAYFAMSALSGRQIHKAYFISPVVDMEKLICDMMRWSNVTEGELRTQKEIGTNFGETLSWEYLCYVRENPVVWQIPTHVLYGEHDNLTSQKTVSDFADKIHATLTVMSGGEHWFHTESQVEFLDNWLKRHAQ